MRGFSDVPPPPPSPLGAVGKPRSSASIVASGPNASFCSSDIKRQHTSAYVSIRQHTSAYVSIRCRTCLSVTVTVPSPRTIATCVACIRPHTPAYVSMRQHASVYVSICQHMSAYVSIRQHTLARGTLIRSQKSRLCVTTTIVPVYCTSAYQRFLRQ